MCEFLSIGEASLRTSGQSLVAEMKLVVFRDMENHGQGSCHPGIREDQGQHHLGSYDNDESMQVFSCGVFLEGSL